MRLGAGAFEVSRVAGVLGGAVDLERLQGVGVLLGRRVGCHGTQQQDAPQEPGDDGAAPGEG
jgi:hypothetical protein